MKILIAVPTSDRIEPEVFKAIYDLRSEHDLAFECVRGYDCAAARNEIARIAQEGGYDYTLMVDADTVIPPTTLEYMLDPPADIVLGLCPRKNTNEGKSAMVKLNAEDRKDNWFYRELPNERTEIKAGGFACAFVRTYVFTHLPYPQFNYAKYEDGSTLSEDYYFCQLARFMGFKIYMDPRVRCGHLARYYQWQ